MLGMRGEVCLHMPLIKTMNNGGARMKPCGSLEGARRRREVELERTTRWKQSAKYECNQFNMKGGQLRVERMGWSEA